MTLIAYIVTIFYSPTQHDEMLNNFYFNEYLASIYYSYNAVHHYLEEPFTSFMPEALFNISRFLMTEIHQHKPPGISQLYTS